jgi:tyrosine-specific transport protein
MFQKRGSIASFLSEKKLLIAITTLIGTIVGAGILGIPYTLAKAGFLYGLLLVVGLGVAFLFLNLFTGEIVLRTKGQHQLAGYASRYLGKWGKFGMMLSMVISLYGALIAYLIGEGATLHSLFKTGSPLLYTLVFFVLTTFIVYKGVKATGRTELLFISLLIVVVVVIGIFSISEITLSHFSVFNPANFFLPYGVIFFAYFAMVAIPELNEVLGSERRKMKKAIVIGSLLPIFLYIIFSVVVVGVVGLENFELLGPNEKIATIALGLYAHPVLGVLANVLAFLAMFTSYLPISIALLGMYHYDYKLPRIVAFGLTSVIPLAAVLFNFTTFIEVLAVTGAVAGGMQGVFLMLMYWRAKKMGDRKPEYSMRRFRVFEWFLLLLFMLGVVYGLLKFFGVV